jgi:hypothetical protein
MRVLKKVKKRSRLWIRVIKWNTNRPVIVLTLWSPSINIRTVQNLIYYFEKRYFIYMVLMHPRLWVSFAMYLYPYRYVSVVPGAFLFRRKFFVSDKSWGSGSSRLIMEDNYNRLEQPIPYFKHPSLCWPVDSTSSGVFNRPGYNNPAFEKKYGMPGRFAIYNALRHLPYAITNDFFDENKEDHKDKLFIHTLHSNSLVGQAYLDYLSKFKFIVCAPGVSMPLCHNLIEALAFGCIPVFSYPAWLPQGLINKVNCFIYTSIPQLQHILEELRNLEVDDFALMQYNLKKYYQDNFLNFVPNIEDYKQVKVLNEQKRMIL